MILRLLAALVGAAAITIGLLLFMNDVSNRFVLRDPTQYFAIMDYFPAPDRGRQLPDVPVIPEVAPDRPQLELDEEETLPLELEPALPAMEDFVPPEDREPDLSETGDPE